jgi:hypothetical protein
MKKTGGEKSHGTVPLILGQLRKRMLHQIMGLSLCIGRIDEARNTTKTSPGQSSNQSSLLLARVSKSVSTEAVLRDTI